MLLGEGRDAADVVMGNGMLEDLRSPERWDLVVADVGVEPHRVGFCLGAVQQKRRSLHSLLLGTAQP